MLQQMDSHWGITVQFEWFICFSVVCICSASLSLSGWSVEYALYVQLVHCGTVWNPIGCLKIEIQDSDNLFFVSFNLSQSRTVCIPCGWRLKFRTVTGTRGFFGKLVLSVCLDIPNLIFCIHLHPHLCLHQIQASSSFCLSVCLDIPIFIFLIFILLIFVWIKVQRTLWPMTRWTGKVLLFWGFSNSIFSSHGHHWETTSWHSFLAHRLQTFIFGQSSNPNTFKRFLLLCISAQRRTVSRMSRNFRKIVDIFAASLDLHWNVSIEKCKLFNQRLHLNEK